MATHTVMPKKLAQALMEAGMHHFDSGGDIPFYDTPGGPDGVPMSGGGGPGRTPSTGVTPIQQQPIASPTTNGIGTAGPGAYGQDVGGSHAINGVGAPNIYMQPNLPYWNQNAWDNSQVTQGNQRLMSTDLANQAAGIGGPSPEQAMLQQQTGQNTSMQAALMAGQRGASSNPALMAKQIAQQGAANQQNAAGQSATMAQQRMLGAQNQRLQLEQSMAQNSLQAQNISQAALASQNKDITAGVLGAQNTVAGVNANNQSSSNNLIGGVLGAGAIAAAMLLNKGGKVKPKGYESGGIIRYDEAADPGTPPAQQQSGSFMSSIMGGLQTAGAISALMSKGGPVPGKSEVKGNSPKNDKVPALLSPGEVVIDKETLKDKGAVGKAARLVADHIENKNAKGSDEVGTDKANEFMKHLKPQKKGYGGVISARNCGGKM